MRRLPITRTFKQYTYTVDYYDFATKEVQTISAKLNHEAKNADDFAAYCGGKPLEYQLVSIDLEKRGMTYDDFLFNSEHISTKSIK